MAEKLKSQLERADLQLKKTDQRLKNVERLVQLIGIVATLVTIISTITTIKVSRLQGNLFEQQTLEAKERQRVAYTFHLDAFLLPDEQHFYVRSKMSNLSTRELSLLMIGIRVWPRDKWTDNISVRNNPTDIIVADNLVRNCSPKMCAEATSSGKLRLRDLSSNPTLETTEKDVQHVYGPYPITKDQLEQGIWVEGWAYVSETDHGDCVVHGDTVPAPGTLPYVCEKKLNDDPHCTAVSKCSNVSSPASFLSKAALIKLVTPPQPQSTEQH
jgi:hypothetical protein